MYPTLAEVYEISAWLDGSWVCLTREDENIHRFRVHTFESVTMDRLRLRVLAAHGEGGRTRVYQVSVFHQ